MKIRHTPRRRARIEMLPLIDVVFLLLVFFIHAMLAMAVQRGLHLDLPQSAQAKSSEDESALAVSVRRQPAGLEVYLDKERLSLEGLGARLVALVKGAEEAPQVSLFVEKNISSQELFMVLDQIRASGVTAVSLQAEAR